MHRIFKKWSLWMWSLDRMEQFSFQIKSQQTCNKLRALKFVLFTPSYVWSFWQNLVSWPKTAFDIAQILFDTFISVFEDINFEVNSDKTLVDLLTFKCKEFILVYELACATVIQPKAGVLNLLLCHGTWVFGENYWPFSQKFI